MKGWIRVTAGHHDFSDGGCVFIKEHPVNIPTVFIVSVSDATMESGVASSIMLLSRYSWLVAESNDEVLRLIEEANQ